MSRLEMRALVIGACLSLLGGCRRRDMFDQPRYDPLEPSSVFPDGASARRPVEGTVARGELRADREFYSGVTADGGFVEEMPRPIDRALLERGRERFTIYCSPCHGQLGDGRGMIVQRGFKRPSSFHVDRLRAMPLGYFVDVITNGFAQMPSYRSQVSPEDRWAIAAYIGALQLSQHAPVAELPREDVERVERAGAGAPPGAP
jgi:mono/diheme cytochrome c family protein